jgi:hypothetical protein
LRKEGGKRWEGEGGRKGREGGALHTYKKRDSRHRQYALGELLKLVV